MILESFKLLKINTNTYLSSAAQVAGDFNHCILILRIISLLLLGWAADLLEALSLRQKVRRTCNYFLRTITNLNQILHSHKAILLPCVADCLPSAPSWWLYLSWSERFSLSGESLQTSLPVISCAVSPRENYLFYFLFFLNTCSCTHR